MRREDWNAQKLYGRCGVCYVSFHVKHFVRWTCLHMTCSKCHYDLQSLRGESSSTCYMCRRKISTVISFDTTTNIDQNEMNLVHPVTDAELMVEEAVIESHKKALED